MSTNDNHSTGEEPLPLAPDAHGQAALVLVESLIHGLLENAALRQDEAIEIAERAVSVQLDRAEEADGAASMWRSHALLASIAASLHADGGNAPAPSRAVP